MASNMAIAVSSYRFERKFAVTELSAHEIVSLIERHPGLFSRAYPSRFVNNIYFDTPDLKNYYDTLNGAADRMKIRIRWYGNLFDPIHKPVLELKIKKGLLGTKQTYPLVPFMMIREGWEGSELASLLQNEDLPGSLRLPLHGYQPVLLNRYHRGYYRSADGNYRITLDTQLEYYGVHSGMNYFLQRHVDRSGCVLELKYDQIHDGSAADMAGYFPFRMTRNSKYLTGLEALSHFSYS